ncbi:MAG: hypothetical protein FDZ69_01590 [Deltaproteobacteria bacterium]|nr:MAG: hypothetical protein FDZ69_01590 [Deltaproteobacteria bacterium]
MIRINLLPVKATQKKEKLKGQLFAALGAVVVTVVLCALAYFQLLGWVNDAKAGVDRKKQEIVRLDKVIEEVKQFEKRQTDLRAKLDVLAKLEKSRSGPVLMLDQLYRAMPDQLWLTAIKEGGGKMVVTGISMNEETVAIFMHNLEASPEFANVVLKEIVQVSSEGAKTHKFDIDCVLENQPKLEFDEPAAKGAKGAKGAAPAKDAKK